MRFQSEDTSAGLGPGRMELAATGALCARKTLDAGRTDASNKQETAKDRRKDRLTPEIISETQDFANGGVREEWPEAHPFRGEGFHCTSAIVPRSRKPSGLKGLSYTATILLFRRRSGFIQSGGHDGIKERHHRAQLQPDLLDLLLLFRFAPRQEIRAALFVFFDPGLGKTPIPNARKQLLHSIARFLRHNSLPGVIITLLRRVAHGIPHIAQPAAIN